MEEQFVTYEIAKQLKEKGFDWHCLAVYMNSEFQIPRGFGMAIITKEHMDVLKGKAIFAPLWQQVIDWLRINYRMYVEVEKTTFDNDDFLVKVRKFNKSFVILIIMAGFIYYL